MKRFLTLSFMNIACLFMLQTAGAQTTRKEKPEKVSRAEAGIQIGVLNGMQNKNLPWLVKKDFAAVGAELSGRFYLSEHFATRLELLFRVSEKEYEVEYIPLFIDLGTDGYIHHHVRQKSMGTMLHLEYHLAGRQDRFRPFFGIAGGMVRYNYRIDDRYEAINKEPLWVANAYKETTEAIQFTQGLTYVLSTSVSRFSTMPRSTGMW